MADKGSPRRKRPKRGKKPERPVVSVRFDPRVLADLKAEAKARGVTVTDAVHRRLLGYRERELQDLEASFYQDEFVLLRQKEFEAALHLRGYVRIAGPGGALWAEPDTSIPATIVKALGERKGVEAAEDAAAETRERTAAEDVVAQTVRRARKKTTARKPLR